MFWSTKLYLIKLFKINIYKGLHFRRTDHLLLKWGSKNCGKVTPQVGRWNLRKVGLYVESSFIALDEMKLCQLTRTKANSKKVLVWSFETKVNQSHLNGLIDWLKSRLPWKTLTLGRSIAIRILRNRSRLQKGKLFSEF